MQTSNTQSSRLLDGLKRIAGGDYVGAHADAIAMIEANVEDPVPYFVLGVVASDHNNIRKAAELFERATGLDPSHARFQAYLGGALTVLGQMNRAKSVADIAATLPNDDAFVADTIGVVYSRTGFHELAVPHFERAVELNSKPANFHYNLGASLQFSGKFDRAGEAYQAAIERQADMYRAYSSLVSLKKQSPTENHLEELTALYEQNQDDPDAALHFGHAIAKTLEDLGRHEESLEWLVKAKASKRSSLAFTIDSDLQNFSIARETYPELAPDTSDTHDAAPIFVIGLPRTGTTLVDRILSSHPEVTSAGELNTFAGLIKEHTGTTSNLVMDAETLTAAKTVDLPNIGSAYIEQTIELARGAKHITDKMPLNFFYAGLIHRALPNARIVALRRGAMDSCLSNFRQLFSTGFSFYNYTFSLEDTARYYTAFDDLMAHWRAVLPSDRFVEVHYEDIVFDQENQTRRLLDFCGLEWDEACMRFHENAAPVSTASSVQVRQPLYSGSIGRWKKYGDALDGLQSALGRLASGH